ncbi:MAG: ScpA family protein [Patescibacteria group bacterium]|nr:ScpA family protein [bacterium]MDZ4240945.1 ScpA family protein [Patescibacteria group bacterium]
MEENNSFKIKTEVFEGPLDLLLSLIEKRKLLINDISLAQVTDNFISYIKSFSDFPIKQSADFILVASTLVLIKSKSLLPTLELSDEEQGSIEDLERRLKQYKRIKELSHHVKTRFGDKVLFMRNPNKNVEPVFSPTKEITVSAMLSSIRDVLKNLPKVEQLAKAVVEKVISLEDMIGRLMERVTSNLKMTFKEFSKHGDMKTKEQKVHVVVSFLALLELVKQGAIKAVQENLFEDIHLESNKIKTPNYT